MVARVWVLCWLVEKWRSASLAGGMSFLSSFFSLDKTPLGSHVPCCDVPPLKAILTTLMPSLKQALAFQVTLDATDPISLGSPFDLAPSQSFAKSMILGYLSSGILPSVPRP